MAFAIPKIQYKNGTTTCSTTSGSGTLTGVADTSELEIGMSVSGTGIPAGATVASFTDSTILLAGGVLATATALSIDLSFSVEIAFDFPPKEPKGEALETKATISESLSGIRQISVNNIEGNRELAFSFLSPAVYTLVDTWLKASGLNGETFRYFEDKTLSSYVEYELDSLKVQPKKLAPRGVDTYVWEVPLRFRRIL